MSEIPKFKLWLRERGSEILAPTNAYEAVRFTTSEGIGLIYRSDTKPISAMNDAAKNAWKAFTTSSAWRCYEATKRITAKTKKDRQRAAIIARDGDTCIYCGLVFNDEIKSIIEHIVPVTAQGPNHLANLALSCEPCEKLAGTLSAAEKIKLAIRRRAERGAL